MSDTSHDPFEDDDNAAGGGEYNASEFDGAAEGTETDATGAAEGKDTSGDAEQDAADDSAAAQDENAQDGAAQPAQAEKMIPESRLKAALKDVTAERDRYRDENNQLKAKPAPDKDTDPEGYDLHQRLEISKSIMRDAVTDYEEVIEHYQLMAKENPLLNEAVKAAAAPAKYAYDIAKRDMEIRELSNLKGSDEWKEFEQYRKDKAAGKLTAPADKTLDLKSNKTSKVPPNLNRATSVASTKNTYSDDDELFKGSL